MAACFVYTGLNLKKGAGFPALLLTAFLPIIDLVRLLGTRRKHRLDTVGRLQTSSQRFRKTQTLNRQGLPNPPIQTRCRRFVYPAKLPSNCQQGRFRFLIVIYLVSCLKLLAIFILKLLGQIPYHILPFMPLTALHHPILAKNLRHRLPESLRSIDYNQKHHSITQTPINELPQKVPADNMILSVALDKAQHHFLTRHGNAQSHKDPVVPKLLAVKEESDKIVLPQPPLHKSPKLLLTGPD